MSPIEAAPPCETLTCAEVARLLRLQPTTVAKKARAGEVPGAYRFGGRWLFRAPAIYKLIKGDE